MLCEKSRDAFQMDHKISARSYNTSDYYRSDDFRTRFSRKIVQTNTNKTNQQQQHTPFKRKPFVFFSRTQNRLELHLNDILLLQASTRI